MIDFARITTKAGDGGRGAGSFEHTKGKRHGKADGGDGGCGGDVYIAASPHINTLETFRFNKRFEAAPGGSGLSKRRKGADGTKLTIKVPLGTQIKSEKEIYDIIEPGQEVLVARGGEGGRGNSHLRDEYGRRPFSGETGQLGEEVQLELELKLIADVGLIGLPNAGKSTLISALTSARPKIANYPFTTLEPNLGVMERANGRIILADIPGLIEGASQGKGLGDLFLRHIERTKIVVHLIDITSTAPYGAYQSVRTELKAYSKGLVKKKEIIVLNKTDLIPQELLKEKIAIFKQKRKRVFAISAQNKTGLDLLVKEIEKKL